MRALRNLGALIGRILIAFIFLNSGAEKLSDFAMFVALMTAHHVPVGVARPLLYASLVIELLGGILLIIGARASIAAFILFLWLIPVTIIFHVMPHQAVEWQKNLAIMGGLLMIAVLGPGGLSFDGRRRRSANDT